MEKASSSKRPRYDAAFRAEALRLADESRSTLALNIAHRSLYQWQKGAQKPLPADPNEANEVRALRAQVRRQAQELEVLKKALAIFSTPTSL